MTTKKKAKVLLWLMWSMVPLAILFYVTQLFLLAGVAGIMLEVFGFWYVIVAMRED